MGKIDLSFNGEIFRKNHPMVIATNRQNAILNPIRVRYQAAGVQAGTVLARNTTDGMYDPYNNSGSSGLDVAKCVLFEELKASDFGGTSTSDSTTAVGIFGGGVTLYKDKLVGLDAAAETDLGMKEIIDATGIVTVKF